MALEVLSLSALGAIALLVEPSTAGDVKLAGVFTDHMVLQRDVAVPIWGTAPPGAKVTVSIGDQSASAAADERGNFLIKLNPLRAGGPHEMAVAAPAASITLHDVLVGEVWVCSGQSNMEWSVSNAADPRAEVAAANHPRLRMFTVGKKVADRALTEVQGEWQICSPQTAGNFSAVGYYFGRELQSKLDVPIGLIHSSWGGTPAESWTTLATLQADADYKPLLDRFTEQAAKASAAPNSNPWQPAGLYHGMIAPLIPYAIKGVIWYQGESNAERAYQYRKLFPAMIEDWRRAWGVALPFLFVQLANFKAAAEQPSESDWAELREAQLMTLAAPHTGMAVTIDIGDANDIHPKNKQEVGRRLALLARAEVYGQSVVAHGPSYRSMKVDGDQIRLQFEHVGGGLVAKDASELRGFAIAGADCRFVWAQAEIEGDCVVVYHDEVPHPQAVRYAWGNNPQCNLVNKEGLPASPFRTDDWPGVTKSAR